MSKAKVEYAESKLFKKQNTMLESVITNLSSTNS